MASNKRHIDVNEDISMINGCFNQSIIICNINQNFHVFITTFG